MPLVAHKRVGETPLEALTRIRKARRIPSDIPMSYAGRLDPMASGKLLILVGEECKQQKDYHALDKEYVVEVVLGLSSDTGDVLGLVEDGASVFPSATEVKGVLASFVGPYRSPYPLFSSKTVGGKPLFQWTLEGEEVEAPLQEGTIRSVRFCGMRRMTTNSLIRYVGKKIATLAPVTEESKALGRDFRKKDALASWERIGEGRFPIMMIKVRTSAGVYMRTLAGDIGEKLGTKGLALSIKRTRIFGV